jgi:hypothetical protein
MWLRDLKVLEEGLAVHDAARVRYLDDMEADDKSARPKSTANRKGTKRKTAAAPTTGTRVAKKTKS